MQLHTAEGARKYLTACERDAFFKAAEQAGRETYTLCMTLAYAGCHLSEALALIADRVDLAAGTLMRESLRKWRSGMLRPMPVTLPYWDLRVRDRNEIHMGHWATSRPSALEAR